MTSRRAFVIVVSLYGFVSGAFAAPGALDECWQAAADRTELAPCLDELQARADVEMAEALARAMDCQRRLDEVTSSAAAADSLRQAQLAFELYRELECSARRAQLASGTGAGDVGRACRVDLTRERVKALEEQACSLPEPSIAGTGWIVQEVLGEAVPEDVEATLEIADDGQVSGSSGCNRYFGSTAIDGAAMTFGALGATKRLCGDPADTAELRFFQALAAVAGWARDGAVLRLVDTHGEPVMILHSASPPLS